MRQSQLFTKTRKEAPKDEVSKNAKLLIRAGFLHKEMAGVYTYLPLGFRVLKKIEQIIREEMNTIGGQEILLTTLQDPGVWKASGRWDDKTVDNWFKTHLHSGAGEPHSGSELGIANTHEEPLTSLLREHASSYRDFPRYIYQFQTKFRNELRAKSGIMRAREFIMKDLYSFSKSEEEFRAFYEACAAAYVRIYERVGIVHVTYRTFASGGSFSEFSDEFQTQTEAGEDTIYLHRGKNVAVNKEVYTDETLKKLGLEKNELEEVKAIEVGNIFPLGTRFSEVLGLRAKDAEGKEAPVIMGSYGIGLGRLLGAVVEVLSDEKGMVWPESVAPFRYHLIDLSGGDASVRSASEALYETLKKSTIEVLYDDRDLRPGEKFADAELIGIPTRLVISGKTVAAGKVEVTDRRTGETVLLNKHEILTRGRDGSAYVPGT
jgi:prolyl-tRNA synthetase